MLYSVSVYDARTLKVTLTAVCFHLGCVLSGSTEGFLQRMFSISTATQEEKSMTSHKNDPGRKFKCQPHTEICLKREGKGGGTLNKYPVIN